MITKIMKTLCPEKLKRKILQKYRTKILESYGDISYSQEGEDMILRKLFETQSSGFYVDVGAHHPVRFSNTYYFYKRGWNGINIDAMPESMKLFTQKRPRDLNIEKPISDKKEVLTYYFFNEPALNGFSKELSKHRDGYNDYCIEFTKDFETSTLEEILDDSLPVNQEIDFLSIDVEGLDFKVIISNNFDKYTPKVILVELLNNTLLNIVDHEITIYLKEHNYFLYAKLVNTVIYISNQFYLERFGK